MTKTVVICDVTGEEGAFTLSYPTTGRQVDPASSRTERVYKHIDLSHSGAMKVLDRISSRFEQRSTEVITLAQFEALVDGMRKT